MVTRGEVWWYEHPTTGRRVERIAEVSPAVMADVCAALAIAVAC